MAISDDTAALVAAQLTTAWASRVASEPLSSRKSPEEEIEEVYRRYLTAVAEKPTEPPKFDIRSIIE